MIIIFVTHDMDEALKLADIIIFMDGGEVVQMASPEEMLENPATERVRSFLGKHASGTQPPSKVEQFMRHQCAVRPTGSRYSGMCRADGTPQRGHPAGGGRMQPLCRNSFHRGYPRMG